MRKRYRDLLLVVLMAAAAWGLSAFAMYNIANLPLFTGSAAADWEMSDLYGAVGKRRDVLQKSGDITLVALDGCDRAGMADALELLAYMEPRALGLDVFFLQEDADGRRIEAALCDFPRLVLPFDLHHPESVSFFQQRIPGAHEGFVNLLSSHATGTVRDFVCLKDGRASFPYALAGAPEGWGEAPVRLKFDGIDFPVIPAAELSLSDEADIRDRIVIAGMMEDPSDTHRSAVGEKSSGMLLHAYAAEMFLSHTRMRELPGWVSTLTALLLSLLFLWVSLLAKRKWDDAGTLLMRCLQLLAIFGLFLLGCRLYLEQNIYLDFSLTITMLALDALVFDIVAGAYALFAKNRTL